MSRQVTLVEVGPRDGFQSIGPFIATSEKIRLIRALAAAGFERIEIGSFVSPRALPQMRDIGEIAAALADLRRTIRLATLVPGARGIDDALRCGVEDLVLVISASDSHSRSNVRRSTAEAATELFDAVRQLPATMRLRLDVATAFHCPFEGRTPFDAVRTLVAQALAMRPDMEICLCDTTGRAAPAQVAAGFARLMQEHPLAGWAYHPHDTYGLGIASSLAAFEAGVRVFDAAVAGLGGCPFAPGASGNLASEDLVFVFDEAGIGTGVELERLLPVAHEAAGLEGAVSGGHVRSVLARGDARSCAAISQGAPRSDRTTSR